MPSPHAASAQISAAAQARAEAKLQLLLRLRSQGYSDLALLRALENAPRENFVAAAYQDLAQRDVAIPLPCGQTMEPPSALARMVAASAPKADSRILEIGTGSGYSALVLSLIGREVVSVECFERLVQQARARLEQVGARNVAVICADGFELSPSLGLFDRILIHAAVDDIPPHIAGALAEDGVMVAPRRLADGGCELVHYARGQGEELTTRSLGPWRAQNLLHGLFAAR